jgi:hypothetical protein
MGRLSHFRFLGFFRRALAVGSILLVLALGVFAQNSSLHRQLHDATATALADDGCVIDLFAHGVSLAVAIHAAPPAINEWQSSCPAVAPEIFVDSPRYLLQPERGPPFA